jgi:hypothetical protein
MTITVATNDTVELRGVCTVEDAETLLQQLLATPDAMVDWSACESAHTAVIQVLLVAGSRMTGSPSDRFLRHFVGPGLQRVER